MKQLLLSFFIFCMVLPRPAQALEISPQCQALRQGANPANYDPNVVDMCLITGYLRTPDNKPAYTIYENESNLSSNQQKIASENIPENPICSQDHPQCPPGSITLKNGRTINIKGQCQLSSQSKHGVCTYTRKFEFSHPIRGLDFADPNLPTNFQTPNSLLNYQLNRFLSVKDKLRLSLDLIFKKLAPSSDQVRLYLGAIDPQTKFSCQDQDGNQGPTYTLKALKELIQTNAPEIETYYLNQNWNQLYQTYSQALKTNQLWAELLACLPLAPFSPSDTPNQRRQNPGFTYMKVKVSFKGAGFQLPAKTDIYPTNAQSPIYYGTLISLLYSLPLADQQRLRQTLTETSPIALTYFPEHSLVKKQTFFSKQTYLNDAYTWLDYATKVINSPKLKTTSHFAPPKSLATTQIQEANAVDTNGFPTNLGKIVGQILNAVGIKLEKHLLTAPSLNQQIVDLFLKTQIQLELPTTDQNLITKEKNHPIALKGSTYAGGLEYLHLYLSRNFSTIIPYSFKEYCPASAQIKDYASGICNPQSLGSLTSPYLSP